jgi:dihydroorotate dehydrogenase electron transfer subunit
LLEGVTAGARLSLLGPLGSTFEPAENSGDCLVAGGVGLAPLLWYAERYHRPRSHHLFYGARTAADLVLLDEIRATGCTVTLTTEDGSSPDGWPPEEVQKGRVTDALAMWLTRRSAPGTRILTCGPNPMMRAVVELAKSHIAGRSEPQALKCLVSVEGEMACGIGACLGCAVPLTANESDTRPFGYACVDGPVFDAARIVIP